MANPFEVADAEYAVLRNQQDQHSLWPAAIDAPAGWTAVHGPASRDDCLAYVHENWTDIRPKDVAEFIGASR
jgi:uncharacterized protein YbdZ (MbtH family)